MRLAQGKRSASIGDRRLDLATVPDDSRVAEQALDVTFTERCDRVGIEAGERRAEVLALAEDRQPGQSRLEALETQSFQQAALIRDGATPFVVVVGEIELVRRRPAALRLRQSEP